MIGQEYNDLSDPVLSASGSTMSSYEASNGSSGASSGGSSSAASASSVSSLIPAVVVTTVVTASIVVMSVLAPGVGTNAWAITHESIGFEFVADESDNPYIVSLNLEDEVIETFTIDHQEQVITFSNLDAETNYVIDISHDYGIGPTVLKTYKVKTAGRPIYPDGQIKIKEHMLDYQTDQLSLSFSLEDEGNYLSHYYFSITDGLTTHEYSIVDILDEVIIDIKDYNRGYLTIEVLAQSTHPQQHEDVSIYTTYKIYY